MSGKEKVPTKSVINVHSLLDEDYVGKEVIVIAFDKEKKTVSLDDSFVLLQSITKRERRVKIIAMIVAFACIVGIILASVKLLQSGGSAQEGKVVLYVTEEPSNTATAEVVPVQTEISTEAPTKKPKATTKPSKKPKRTKKPTAKPVIDTPEPVIDTPEPVIDTPEPVIDTPEPVVDTPKPVVDTPKPKPPTKEPETSNDNTFVEEEDDFVERK